MTGNEVWIFIGLVLFCLSGIVLGVLISRLLVPPQYLPMYIDRVEYVYRTRTVVKEPDEHYEEFEIPDGNHQFKSYLDESLINDHHKIQWAFMRIAEPNDDGLMMIDDCYCVAMGSFYGSMGSVYRVTLDSGKVFKVKVCERKADEHTDPLHQYTVLDGSIIEFIVDMDKLKGEARTCGNISVLGFEGNIVKLEYRIEDGE